MQLRDLRKWIRGYLQWFQPVWRKWVYFNPFLDVKQKNYLRYQLIWGWNWVCRRTILDCADCLKWQWITRNENQWTQVSSSDFSWKTIQEQIYFLNTIQRVSHSPMYESRSQYHKQVESNSHQLIRIVVDSLLEALL